MSGLFGTFNVGKRGLFAQQRALDVTSHNVANANTEGYSRQRAILETTTPFGMPSMDSQVGPGQIGTGVDVSSIQRVRDSFMDYQVRREKSTLGQYEARDKYLSEIESIFNEPSEDGLSTLIGNFFTSWDELSKKPENSNARTVVAQQSAALADEINHVYTQLSNIKSNAQESIKQTVLDVNAILNRVDKLNQQIISVKVSGMEPNDLMDKRDLLLDNLSEKFNIKVESGGFYSVNVSPDDVSGLNNNVNSLLIRKNPNDAVRKFSYVTGMEKLYKREVIAVDTSKIVSHWNDKAIKFSIGTENVEININGITGTSTTKDIAKKINDELSKTTFKDRVKVVANGNSLEFISQEKVTMNNPTKSKKLPTGINDGMKIEKDMYKITYIKGADKDKSESIYVEMTEEECKTLDQTRILWAQSDPNNDEKDGMAIDKNGGEITSGSTIEFKDLALFNLPMDENRGELKGYMSVQKDVDKYIDQLNKLAKGIAFSVNAVHSGKVDVSNTPTNTNPPNTDYMPFFVNKDTAHYQDDELDNLENTLQDEDEITAANISINKEILNDVMKIKTRTNDDEFAYEKDNDVDGKSDGKRALAISELRNTLMQIQNITDDMDRKDFIENITGDKNLVDDGYGVKSIKSDINGMKIDNYFKDTIDKLGIQEQEAQRVVSNQSTLLQNFQERRDSISGVSLDEEMANLIQFQHAYQANSKIIATVDELLDVVINGLKR